MAVVIDALTYLTKAVCTTTAVVVLAAVVLTALPGLTKFVPSREPCNCTSPALAPAVVVTVITAFCLTDKPSNAIPD
jgi:MFS superfamily sulfate permease-like transporter